MLGYRIAKLNQVIREQNEKLANQEIPEGMLDGEITVEDNAETGNPEIIPCPNCGRPTHRTCLMNGGSCCSECYDSEEY